jgi:LysR family transcriptional activator of nhaA
MIPLNFNHLYYFLAVAEHGTVSKAARELRLSQPALSTQLKQLQDYLGTRLFERKGKKLVLTEEGQSALLYARQIFDTGREFVDGLHDRSLKGRVRIQIGISNSVPKAFAAALLTFLLKKEPSASLQVREDVLPAMAKDLEDHKLDLLLSDMPFQADGTGGIENHLAGKIPVLFCAHVSLARKYGTLPRGLDGAPVILPTSDSRIYHAVQEYFIEKKVKPRIIAEIQDIELVRRLVLEKAGIAPLSRFETFKASFSPNIVPLQQKASSIYETIYLITKKRKRPHPLAETAVKHFRLA